MGGVPSEMEREFVHLGGCLGVQQGRNEKWSSWLSSVLTLQRHVHDRVRAIRPVSVDWRDGVCFCSFKMRRTVFVPVPPTTGVWVSGRKSSHRLWSAFGSSVAQPHTSSQAIPYRFLPVPSEVSQPTFKASQPSKSIRPNTNTYQPMPPE